MRGSCCSRAMVASLALAVTVASACQSDDLESRQECVERIVWHGQEYGGTRHRAPLGERLGRTATLGCRGEPNRHVAIFSVQGVRPAVAIAVRPDGGARFLGLGAGYIVESRRHPLHRAVFETDHEPDAFAHQRCRRPRIVMARALTTPVYQTKSLVIAAERRADRRYLRGDGVRGVVSFDAGSTIHGFDRGGVPFVKAGDRFRVVLRACTYGPEAPPGLRGLDRLVVVRLGPA
jgi:hypothetical protein